MGGQKEFLINFTESLKGMNDLQFLQTGLAAIYTGDGNLEEGVRTRTFLFLFICGEGHH